MNGLQYAVLAGLVIFLRIWIAFDQVFISTDGQRRAVFYSFVFLVFILFYFFVKPKKPVLLSVNLSIVLLATAVLLCMIQHSIINHDLNLYAQELVILWLFIFVIPPIS